MLCSGCNASLEEHFDYCPHCGRKLLKSSQNPGDFSLGKPVPISLGGVFASIIFSILISIGISWALFQIFKIPVLMMGIFIPLVPFLFSFFGKLKK
jgi:hypothetical protein